MAYNEERLHLVRMRGGYSFVIVVVANCYTCCYQGVCESRTQLHRPFSERMRAEKQWLLEILATMVARNSSNHGC